MGFRRAETFERFQIQGRPLSSGRRKSHNVAVYSIWEVREIPMRGGVTGPAISTCSSRRRETSR